MRTFFGSFLFFLWSCNNPTLNISSDYEELNPDPKSNIYYSTESILNSREAGDRYAELACVGYDGNNQKKAGTICDSHIGRCKPHGCNELESISFPGISDSEFTMLNDAILSDIQEGQVLLDSMRNKYGYSE